MLPCHPQPRACGAPQALLRESISRLAASGSYRFTLEVRAGNSAALALYAKVGMQCVGRRKRYYKDGEDALILDTSLGPDPDADPDAASDPEADARRLEAAVESKRAPGRARPPLASCARPRRRLRLRPAPRQAVSDASVAPPPLPPAAADSTRGADGPA